MSSIKQDEKAEKERIRKEKIGRIKYKIQHIREIIDEENNKKSLKYGNDVKLKKLID